MVYDLERDSQYFEMSEAAPGAHPVFFRTYSRQRANDSASVPAHNRSEPNQTEEVVTEALMHCVNAKVQDLLRLSKILSNTDPRTESITGQLAHYRGGIILESLGREGPSFRTNDVNRTIGLNREAVVELAKAVPKDLRVWALLVFLFHEVAHSPQGCKHHEDVRRLKNTDESFGQERIAEFDLRNDFLAVHTISLYGTLRQCGVNNRQKYIAWFYRIWDEVSGTMLNAFRAKQRKDKQQRIFGFLLMLNLICDAHLEKRPLEFDGEMWPVWNESLNRLSIFSNGYLLHSGSPVDSTTMAEIIEHISTNEYREAASKIQKIWSRLPRR